MHFGSLKNNLLSGGNCFSVSWVDFPGVFSVSFYLELFGGPKGKFFGFW
jgi:hypothetical protein